MKFFWPSTLFLLLAFTPLVYGAESFGLPVQEHFSISTNPGENLHTDPPNRYAYDLSADDGVPVVAVADGTVIFAGEDSSGKGGNCVIISHATVNSQYCHLGSILVSGGPVTKGQQIGTVGSTGGESSGPHLHFSLLQKGASSWLSVPSNSYIDFSGFTGYNPNATGGPVGANPVNPIDYSVISGLVQNFYKFALAIGGLLALAIIVYGGILYIASPANESLKSEGKEWIKAAIFGLVLLALAYLILNTINPCLVGGPACHS